jgi:hypothetical protein
MREIGLRDADQRVGPLGLQDDRIDRLARSFCGSAGQGGIACFRGSAPAALRVERRRECLPDHVRLLGRELDFDPHHSTWGLGTPEESTDVGSRIARIDASTPIGPRELFDLRRSRTRRDIEEILFGLERGHSCDGANFGIAQRTRGECSIDTSQLAERPSDANMLARGHGPNVDSPSQPCSRGHEARVRPSVVRVEFTQMCE